MNPKELYEKQYGEKKGEHLHHFTKRALCKALKEPSFKIIKVSGSGLFTKIQYNWSL